MSAWLLLLLGCPGPPAPTPKPVDPRPSVLIITLDTTRADRLGPYGYAAAETPTWDRLSSEGTRFDRAYSVCPLTIPAHSSIFTGRYPPSHGVRDNGDFILSEEAVTLAERFQAAGYATAAFTSAFPTQRRWGFAQGFDVYEDPLERLPTQLDWRDQRPANEVIDGALAKLPELDGAMFVWVHLFDAHWPYAPPEPFASRFEDPYDGEIAFADSEAARLIAWWDEHRPNSVVVVTADHGEALGDGGEQTHGFLLHDGTIHIPLILRGTGVPVGVSTDPVSQVDIVPTLLELTDLPAHDGLQGKNLLEGGSERTYSEALTGQFNLGLAPLYAYTDQDGRYMEGSWGGWYPSEDHKIGFEPDKKGNEQRARELAALRGALEEVEGTPTTLDPEATDLLMALGYLGGNPSAPAGDVDPRDVIDIVPLTWRVRQLLGVGAFPRARALIERLEARMPGTFGVEQLRAHLLRRQGRIDEAIEAHAALYLKHPSSTLAVHLGMLYATRAQWVEALSWYEEAHRLQPASPEAMAGRVRSLRFTGQDAAASELAQEFLQVYPDHAELMLVRAEDHLHEHRLDEAVADAEAALAQMPWAPRAWALLGDALWERGDADRGIENLQEALRLAPFDVTLRTRLVECYLDVGRNAEATRTAAPMARLLPDDEAVQALHKKARAALEAERAR